MLTHTTSGTRHALAIITARTRLARFLYIAVAQEPGNTRTSLPTGRPVHLPTRVRHQPRPPRPAADTHAVASSEVRRENKLLRPVAHHFPSAGQWPRLIGIRCRARHGSSPPHRQTHRQRRQHQTGRCRRAKVRTAAKRCSSYETRRSSDTEASLLAAGWCGAPRAWSNNRRRAASCSSAWTRSPKPETAGGEGEYRLTIRRKSPTATVMCLALRPEGTKGQLPRSAPDAVKSSITPGEPSVQNVTVR